jgi:type III restriction enzyme
MNTVGKHGKLGEQIKCVVSVSMLTEGWDANSVTHILGVRAFGTQLLCEQVVGRGLRRMSYATNADGMFSPEYAEVYGVPFSFIPCSGSNPNPKPGPTPTRVRALENRIACEITFPRVIGYRYELPAEKLSAKFTQTSRLALSSADVPTRTEMASVIGEHQEHKLYGLREKREQEIDFKLASLILEKYFRDADNNQKPWLFPQLLNIVRHWRAEYVTCKDNTFPQMLMIAGFAHEAADKIYHAIVESQSDEKTLRPILRPYDPIGSTRYVDFDTTRPTYPTDPRKCHISHVVADTGTWEQKMAQALEEMDEVVCYAKNQNLGFTIPYTLNGEEHGYLPDFIARVKAPAPTPALPRPAQNAGQEREQGAPQPEHAEQEREQEILNLIVEVSGEARKDKAAKVATARTLWAPAINNHGGFGRWAFIEISDPWDAQNTIRAFLRGQKVDGVRLLLRGEQR